MSDSSKEEKIIGQLLDICQETSTEERDWDSFGRDTTIEDLGLDSLTILDLLYDIEQEIGIHLEAQDVVSVRTVGEITDLLVAKGA
ncbi:MAG: acyl carrier protein [Verrucomicrobia bacterium]|nr:acyl carrier protein [Verrucomicrobiota bacterium]